MTNPKKTQKLAAPGKPSTIVSGRRACRDGIKTKLAFLERTHLHITSANPNAQRPDHKKTHKPTTPTNKRCQPTKQNPNTVANAI